MERVPPFRMRVERKTPSLWAVLFIFLFFISLLLILFLRSPLSHIQTISIRGNQLFTKQEILHQSGLHTGVSYFGIKDSEVEAGIQKMSAVNQVKVEKQFPNKISIEVVEYPVVAYLNEHQVLTPLLANGTVFLSHPATTELSSMPIFEGWEKEKPAFKQILSQFVHVSTSIRNEIVAVRPMMDKPGVVLLLTRHQHKIEVRIDQLAERMKLYPRFLKQPPGTLHLLESIWFTPDH